MLKSGNIRLAVALVYMTGAALTYNHVVRAGREALTHSSELSSLVLESLFESVIWLAYWLHRGVLG
jgi:hypothetical protein